MPHKCRPSKFSPHIPAVLEFAGGFVTFPSQISPVIGPTFTHSHEFDDINNELLSASITVARRGLLGSRSTLFTPSIRSIPALLGCWTLLSSSTGSSTIDGYRPKHRDHRGQSSPDTRAALLFILERMSNRSPLFQGSLANRMSAFWCHDETIHVRA
jgi:hypothetical protein